MTKRDTVTATIGVVVNPVAGIGGPAGLKGSDGAAVQAAARERGATERAGTRAAAALAVIARAHPGAPILTVAGPMGENAVRSAGLTPVIVHRPSSTSTDGDDTTRSVEALAGAGATLILFAGGDGTARDVADARRGTAAVLGIPAGVKMYSACFALSPAIAGAVAVRWLGRGPLPTADREVLDVDEDAVRHGRVDPVLHGTVPVPVDPGRTQARKAATASSSHGAVRSAAAGAVERMRDGITYLLGPGSTVGAVAALLGVPGTPLGVDVVRDGELVLADASEVDLLDLIVPGATKAVLTIIGGQGFLLGRGNQQISAAVLGRIGDDPLIVVATEEKLVDLGGRPLLVDTGDPDLDENLAGHVEVVTGPRAASLYPVVAPESEGRA